MIEEKPAPPPPPPPPPKISSNTPDQPLPPPPPPPPQKKEANDLKIRPRYSGAHGKSNKAIYTAKLSPQPQVRLALGLIK